MYAGWEGDRRTDEQHKEVGGQTAEVHGKQDREGVFQNTPKPAESASRAGDEPGEVS